MSPLKLLFLFLPCLLVQSANPIAPKLPFMLFASDFVSEIQFPVPTCVFVNAAQQTNISEVTFTPENPGGEAVNANSFLHDVNNTLGDVETRFGVHCFDNSTLKIRIDYGSLFAGLNEDSVEWRSAIFYFMEKAKVKNVCAGRGTHKTGGNIFAFSDYESRNEDIAVHAACPIVLLTPTGVRQNEVFDENSNCPTVSLQNFDYEYVIPDDTRLYANFPDDLLLEVSTVPHGVKNLSNLEMFTLTKANFHLFGYTEETFLRSAVHLRSNQPRWIEKVIYVTNNNGVQRRAQGPPKPNLCHLERDLALRGTVGTSWKPTYLGYVDSDPLGPNDVSLEVGVMMYQHSFVELNISAYNTACCSVEIAFTYPNETAYKTIQNLTGIHRFDDPYAKSKFFELAFLINIRRAKTKACESENVRLFYSLGQVGPPTKATTTMRPTTKAIGSSTVGTESTTTNLTTVSASSAAPTSSSMEPSTTSSTSISPRSTLASSTTPDLASTGSPSPTTRSSSISTSSTQPSSSSPSQPPTTTLDSLTTTTTAARSTSTSAGESTTTPKPVTTTSASSPGSTVPSTSTTLSPSTSASSSTPTTTATPNVTSTGSSSSTTRSISISTTPTSPSTSSTPSLSTAARSSSTSAAGSTLFSTTTPKTVTTTSASSPGSIDPSTTTSSSPTTSAQSSSPSPPLTTTVGSSASTTIAARSSSTSSTPSTTTTTTPSGSTPSSTTATSTVSPQPGSAGKNSICLVTIVFVVFSALFM